MNEAANNSSTYHVPPQVMLRTSIRAFVCFHALFAAQMAIASMRRWGEEESSVEGVFSRMLLVVVVIIVYKVLRRLWAFGLDAAVLLAVWGGSVAIAGIEMFDVLGDDSLPDLIGALAIVVLMYFTPLGLVIVLRHEEKCHGIQVASRFDYLLATVRVSLLAIYLMALFPILAAAELAWSGLSENHFMDFARFALGVIVPLVAWRAWNFNFRAAVLLAISGIGLIVLAVVEIYSYSIPATEIVGQTLFHLPRAIPAVVLWWIIFRGGADYDVYPQDPGSPKNGVFPDGGAS